MSWQHLQQATGEQVVNHCRRASISLPTEISLGAGRQKAALEGGTPQHSARPFLCYFAARRRGPLRAADAALIDHLPLAAGPVTRGTANDH